jgi:Putative auto-transporter adhesin, head GIN domain
MLLVNASASSLVVNDCTVKSLDRPFFVYQDTRQIVIESVPNAARKNPIIRIRWILVALCLAYILLGYTDAFTLFVVAILGLALLMSTSCIVNIGGSGIQPNVALSTPRARRNERQGKSSIFIGDAVFSSVAVTGSGGVRMCDQKHVDEVFTATVSGSGDVELNNLMLQRLTVRVDGSGDVTGTDTNVGAAILRIRGSGDISGMHITTWVEAEVRGSGDISCTINRDNCVANRTVKGSGDIRLLRK